ncbi:MAG: pyrroline-5-carboxylate reductase [Bacteroidales bacterium]|nr:pyrroline-5-carboxylate reductase [Bacteroidales bacterium]
MSITVASMKITVIGAGNMGGALVKGFIKSGAVSAKDVTVSDVSQANLGRMKDYNPEICLCSDNVKAVSGADFVVIAVKPWIAEKVVRQIADAVSVPVISIAAGVACGTLREWLGGKDLALFRVIPNTAAEFLESMTFVQADGASADEKADVMGLLGSVGAVMEIEEKMFPAATTLSSCGIAYAMKYIRASMQGGITLGFAPKVSEDIVLQTVKGAAKLLQESGNHPEAEIDKVTTPGGITIKGINAMEANGFTNAVIEGILAGGKA